MPDYLSHPLAILPQLPIAESRAVTDSFGIFNIPPSKHPLAMADLFHPRMASAPDAGLPGLHHLIVFLGGNVDAKTQKDFIRLLIQRLRETIEELYAYRVAAGIAEDQGFPFAATLKNALEHPAIKSRAEEQLETCKNPRQIICQATQGLEGLIDDDADSTDEQINEFLRDWKSEGAPN
jgi:hypothetical protein